MATDYPSDGEIIIKVQDGLNSVEEVIIELLPPGVYIEDVYTVGNAGITVGAIEDIYVQLNAVGGVGDINTIQAQLLQWSCTDAVSCTGKQVFNVTSENPQLQTSTTTTTGSTTIYNQLYKMPVLTPDYAELVNGAYTYVITVYDAYNQQTTEYLQTYIGILIDGDINGDQSIDILDIVKTVMYYLNWSEKPTQQELDAVDFNNNQQIDLVDVIKVIQTGMEN